MFGKKSKELQDLLTQRNSENELMKKRIAELEAEVIRLKEQESLVLRALTDANRTAELIEKQAGEEKDKLLAEANEKVQETEQKISEMLTTADEEAAGIKKEADDYSENIRTDANIYVERTIIASQLEVRKRKDVMAEMNELLKKTTDYLNEQTETFTAMLKSVIEDSEKQTNEICADVEKCNCSCKDCKEPCMEHAGEGNGEGADEEEGEYDEASPATEAEPAAEPEPVNEPDPAAADLLTEEKPEDEEPSIDPEELPKEYKNPAELMKNIYLLQKRDIPAHPVVNLFSDRSPEGGLTFRDELEEEEKKEAELPHDKKLEELVDEVVSAS